jgi:GT2 family glycosyltransferase
MLASVLIPCWNALDLTKVCLGELTRATTRPFEAVIVDNGSRDGTWAWLTRWRRRQFRSGSGALKGVTLLRNPVNRGYAAAMNQAIAAARGKHLVFGNADAAAAPRWLEEMSGLFDARRRLGGLAPSSNPPAVGSRQRWSARPWYDGLKSMPRFFHACGLRPRAEPFYPAEGFVPGFWFMTSRAALDRVGAFDERFKLGGFEDWDLQLRLRDAGYEVGFAGRAYVHHEWAGIIRRNGVDLEALNAAQRPLFDAKHPRAPRWRLLLKLPTDDAPVLMPPGRGRSKSLPGQTLCERHKRIELPGNNR